MKKLDPEDDLNGESNTPLNGGNNMNDSMVNTVTNQNRAKGINESQMTGSQMGSQVFSAGRLIEGNNMR